MIYYRPIYIVFPSQNCYILCDFFFLWLITDQSGRSLRWNIFICVGFTEYILVTSAVQKLPSRRIELQLCVYYDVMLAEQIAPLNLFDNTRVVFFLQIHDKLYVSVHAVCTLRDDTWILAVKYNELHVALLLVNVHAVFSTVIFPLLFTFSISFIRNNECTIP